MLYPWTLKESQASQWGTAHTHATFALFLYDLYGAFFSGLISAYHSVLMPVIEVSSQRNHPRTSASMESSALSVSVSLAPGAERYTFTLDSVPEGLTIALP